MGLRSLLPTSLATICMAKGQPPTLYCTQGALPHRTCLCCMGTSVVRVLCPLQLRQCGSSLPSQSAPRSGPDCIPPFAMLGALHGTVRLLHTSNSHCWEFKLWCRSIIKRQADTLLKQSPYGLVLSDTGTTKVDGPIAPSRERDITSLETTVQQFLQEGLAASTCRVYKAGWTRYITFTTSLNLPTSPLTAEKVTLFVAYLGSEGLSISTIQSYMAALCHFQVLADPSSSFHPSTPHTWQFCCEGLRDTSRCRVQSPFGYLLQLRLQILSDVAFHI